MRTARLDEIIRQKDPALKEAVEQLRAAKSKKQSPSRQPGRVHEIGDRSERIAR